ncbi:MAG TPA: 4'-phosphopantetheinyl transferase superfamily protein [Nitrospirota bacterium]|nr:4'-phosphopantetheinyl transferase superfamily protein [Nitrospirota bacterium]
MEILPHLFERPPDGLRLGTDEIHIWFSVLNQSVPEINKFYLTLSADERERAGRFHRYQDKRRFIVRHGILRMILGCYLDVEPGELRFKEGENGKPEIDGSFTKRTLQFNLSHSQGVALFAFTQNYDIGVDIEHIHDFPEMDQIVERFFSVKEKAAYQLSSVSQRRETFFKGWTCKEAFIKAIGNGLSQPLRSFDVSMAPGESSELLGIEGDLRETARWSIHNMEPIPNYAGALAVRSKLLKLKCWQWK